jgi:hypothetical protein
MRAIGISLLLAVIPFGFVVYMFLSGDLGVPPHGTVDGLFTLLILLTISGVMVLNALLEARAQGLIHLPGMGTAALAGAAGGGSVASAVTAGDLKAEVGVIEHVDYFDAPIGQTNKSLVRLRAKGEKEPHTLVLAGNMRGLLIPGRRMQLIYRPQKDFATLVDFAFK